MSYIWFSIYTNTFVVLLKGSVTLYQSFSWMPREISLCSLAGSASWVKYLKRYWCVCCSVRPQLSIFWIYLGQMSACGALLTKTVRWVTLQNSLFSLRDTEQTYVKMKITRILLSVVSGCCWAESIRTCCLGSSLREVAPSQGVQIGFEYHFKL